MERLLKNIGGYKGETIDIDSVLRDIDSLAAQTAWSKHEIQTSTHTIPAYYRTPAPNGPHLYISAGIHGDEPAAPLSVLKLFQQNEWPAHLNLWIIPCLNPGGFRLNRRENENGIDLNRDFRNSRSEIIRAHMAWVDTLPRFTVALCLHEDWESQGFYLYELNPELQRSFADEIIKGVEKICPIDRSPEIEGRKAQNGIICANPDLPKRPDWPEAFYLVHNKTRLTYTFEAASDYLLPVRIHALAAGAQAVMRSI
jgi:protein MpaA